LRETHYLAFEFSSHFDLTVAPEGAAEKLCIRAPESGRVLAGPQDEKEFVNQVPRFSLL
jgi:hypothetical protein